MRASLEWQLPIAGAVYPAAIHFRRRRSFGLTYRLAERRFVCLVPANAKNEAIRAFLARYAAKLKSRVEEASPPPPIQGDAVYLFGALTVVPGFGSWERKRQTAFLRAVLERALAERLPFWRGAMGILSPYEARVRAMVSRWGVNHKSRARLTFALSLVHYAPPILDSVIVHELAHDAVRGHGPDFYAIVLRFFPDYRAIHAKLRHGQYA